MTKNSQSYDLVANNAVDILHQLLIARRQTRQQKDNITFWAVCPNSVKVSIRFRISAIGIEKRHFIGANADVPNGTNGSPSASLLVAIGANGGNSKSF